MRAARFPARKSLEDFDFDHKRSLKRETTCHGRRPSSGHPQGQGGPQERSDHVRNRL
jgi:hypothetical protein